VTLNGTTSTTLSAGVGSFSGLTLSSTTSQSGESLTATINLNGSLNLTATSNPFNVIVITLSPTSLNSGTVASFYSQQITASNGTAPYTYSVGAGLPAGLTLTSSGVDAGLLSGIPTAGGTFNFTITATDNLGNSGSQAYTLVVGAPTIIVSPATLASGTYGTSYNQSVSASGGTASYTYALAGGRPCLPD
jgi:large repetitive protein